jgi:1,4-alpha-glucan branching enzyme
MSQEIAQQEFWDWFTQHEPELLDFEADRETVFDRLATELHKVHPDLTFEFGPPEEKREFVVSADGI